MEISFVLIKDNIKRFKPFVFELKSLIIGEEKEEIWTMASQSFINLKYIVRENKIYPKINIMKSVDITQSLSNNNNIVVKHHNSTQKLNSFLNSSPKKENTRNILSPLLDGTTKLKSFFNNKNNMDLNCLDNIKANKTNDQKRLIYTPEQIQNEKQLNFSYEIIESKEFPSSTSSTLSETFYTSTLSDTFCQSIFISGITNNSKLISSSEEFLAPCGHKECSMLQAISPELMNSYSNAKNVQHYPEITNQIVDMCFPVGMKICYHCSFDKNRKISHIPKPQQTFYNIIKNEKEEIFYMATLQYFIKMTRKEFDKTYGNFNTLQNFINRISVHRANKDKAFQEFFQTLSQMMVNDTVLIPESISLISKYPYFYQMDTALKCLISLPKNEMNFLISHIINEIPIPQKNTNIQFYLPRTVNVLKLYNEKNISENISNLNYGSLFDFFSIDNIILLFHLLILEQKVLLIDNNYKLLSEMSLILINLLYPFMWVNPYVPILSLNTAKFLQSFIPFLYGIDEYLLKYSDKNKYMNNNGDIVFVFISKKTFSLCKNRKKLSKKDIIKELSIPDLPEKVYSFLTKNLKDVYKQYKKISQDELNKTIKDIFIKAMIILIGDYKNYTFVTGEEMPLFNREAFMNAHNQRDMKMFLNEMTSTQIFNQFLFNEKISFNNNTNSNIDLKPNLYIDSSYFLSMISKNKDLINTQQVRRRSCSNSLRRNTQRSRSSVKQSDNSLITSHLNSSFHNSSNTNNVTLIEKINQKKDKPSIKEYLLVPYFISNPIIYATKEKIEEYISSYLKKKQYKDINVVEQHCFIISNQKEYMFAQIKQTKIYLVGNNNINNTSIKKSISKQNLCNSETKQKLDGQGIKIKKSLSLSHLIQKENNNKGTNDTQYLSDIFKTIITSKQKIKTSSFTKITSLLSIPSNREFFVFLIFPEYSISNEENHKQLTSQSYSDFLKIMTICLSLLTNSDISIGRLLTLACFSYYKIEKEIIRYVYEDLIIGSYPCKLWIDRTFWFEFFEGEKNENNYNNDIYDIGENDNNELNVNILDEAIRTMADIMLRLHLNIKFVKEIICEGIAKKYNINEQYCNNLFSSHE